ncbi:MAG: LytR C-terminal domain-containing protein [Pseudomonadota bacterium]
MRPSLKHLTAACAGTLLMACVQVGRSDQPVAALPAFAQADQAYLAGRNAHLAQRADDALAAYRAALLVDPAHVNAQNGLATLYAEQGQYARAIALWQALTAAAPATTASAYLFSNLGYAHLLNGAAAAAVVALEKACLLDPLSHRAWRHLGNALEKLGQHERAQHMLQQAAGLESHDFKVDYTAAQRSGVAAAIDTAVAASQAVETYPLADLRPGSGGIFELRRAGGAESAATEAPPDSDPVPASAAPAKALAAREPAAPPARTPVNTTLEIRNGNGVTGMARRLARKLGDASIRVARLSNHKGFNIEHTRIEYQPGFREAALRLAERFDDAALVEVAAGEKVDVRLVLGRDLMRSKIEARRLIRAALARTASRAAL